MSVKRLAAAALLGLLGAGSLGLSHAADWPQWRGESRAGVWEERGILDRFPPSGLTFRWRTPAGAGYAGPAVAQGRVFVTDFIRQEGSRGTERVLCLDEKTGKVLWSGEWPADYAGLQYGSGPRATPTVDGERVYVLGAMGSLRCLRVRDGELLWKRDFPGEFSTQVPAWGMTSAPLVIDGKLIAVVGGRPGAKVVAFDKLSGREIWRALSSEDSEPGYSQPILIEAGGRRQVIIWHAGAVSSLDPESGGVFWEHPFAIRMSTPIATPAVSLPYLLVSAFFNGSRLLRLASGKPAATLVWKGASDSAIDTDGLHALMAAPIIDGGYIYGICSYGQLRCLRLDTGERVWESLAVTGEKARNASAFFVRHQDRYFINNDRGELILARLSPAGYEEISRTQLIRPTSQPGARRELGAVNWSHPAYANRHIFARNDEEIVCASLEAR